MKKIFKIGFALVLAGIMMVPHCGKALAAERAEDASQAQSGQTSGQGTLPKTGLADCVSFWMLGAMVTFAGAAMVMRKRKEA